MHNQDNNIIIDEVSSNNDTEMLEKVDHDAQRSVEGVSDSSESQESSLSKEELKAKSKAERLEARKTLKRGLINLAKYMGKYKIALLAAVLFSIASSVFMILAPSWMNRLTNIIIDITIIRAFGDAIYVTLPTNFMMNYVIQYGTILVIFFVAGAILDYIQTLIMVRINNRVAMDLRAKIAKKINTVPLSYYDKNTVGDVLSRTTNDVDRIGESLTWNLTPLIGHVVIIIGTLFAMFWNSWQLAFTALATIPVAIILVGGFVAISQKYYKRQADLFGKINGIVEENYSGQSVVKAFNGQVKSAQEFSKVNDSHFKASFGVQFFQALLFPSVMFIANLGFIAVCVVGGILHVNGTVAIGTIVAFTLYVRMFQQSVGSIGESVAGMQAMGAASARVFEFLEEPEQTDESEKGNPLTEENFRGKVEFKNVKFGYLPEKTIIHNFSAVVEPGQKVAIVGPTGAGKTTMVNLLMRFYEIDGGQILIDGVDIADMRREDVRQLFGMVLQDTWLFDGTIKENIKYALTGASDARVEEVCKAVGVDHFIKGLPDGYNMQLSDEVNIAGGQRQLLTIARAMLQDSPCLILDEATSNVDTRTEKLIQDAMDKLTRGRTSFVIAHRLSTIKNSDLIIAMKDGDVVESGTHDQLIAKDGFYAGLYNSQFSEETE